MPEPAPATSRRRLVRHSARTRRAGSDAPRARAPAPRSPASASPCPTTVVANAPIAERLGIDESWIVQRTGIDERRVAAPDETPLRARRAPPASAPWPPPAIAAAELDLVLVATTSNDELMPGASPRVAAALGASAAGAIDLNAACTGFVSGALPRLRPDRVRPRRQRPR